MNKEEYKIQTDEIDLFSLETKTKASKRKMIIHAIQSIMVGCCAGVFVTLLLTHFHGV